MSRYSGKFYKGAARDMRDERRHEAQVRQSNDTPVGQWLEDMLEAASWQADFDHADAYEEDALDAQRRDAAQIRRDDLHGKFTPPRGLRHRDEGLEDWEWRLATGLEG